MIKIKFIKNNSDGTYKKGDVISCSSEDAKQIIDDGYAESIKITKPKTILDGLREEAKDKTKPKETNELLIEEKDLQEIENWVEGINWITDDNYNTTWKRCVRKTKHQLKIKEGEKDQKLFLLAHSKEVIQGKPQTLHETYKTIPLIRKTCKKDKDSNEDKVSYKSFGDSFDKRYDGHILQQVNENFMTYKIVDKGHEYNVLSKEPLGTGLYKLSGMSIELSEAAEFSKTLKIPGIAKLFIVKEAEPAIKKMDKQTLIAFTKNLYEKHGIDMEGFRQWTFLHPDEYIYLHHPDYDLITIAQQLSGKYQGYGLHKIQFGRLAVGKTVELECLDHKFQEESGIYEAGTSKLKGLIPSFKDNPIKLGYCLQVVRIGLVDELMKMVANAMENGRSAQTLQDHLNQLHHRVHQGLLRQGALPWQGNQRKTGPQDRRHGGDADLPDHETLLQPASLQESGYPSLFAAVQTHRGLERWRHYPYYD